MRFWVATIVLMAGCITETEEGSLADDGAATADGAVAADFGSSPDGAPDRVEPEPDLGPPDVSPPVPDAAPDVATPPDAQVPDANREPPEQGEDLPEVDALPLDIIDLTQPDEPGARWSWTVLERPDGSTSQVVEEHFDVVRPADGGRPDLSETPRAFFFLDLAGSYWLELIYTPPEGRRVVRNLRIVARPDSDIHVQMVWDTPADPDQTDGDGTDMDLHLLHPTGRGFNIAPFDCYWSNSNPDWGPQGPAGNPSLDIDDTNGAGPENINLDDPEIFEEGFYRVGVDYYRSDDFIGMRSWGPSVVTVRVFLDGELALTEVKELERTGNFWAPIAILVREDEMRALATGDPILPNGP